MEKISTDIFTFEKLRNGHYVYVDKTDLLWQLASNNEGGQFFISRPRRFGKSLMLSTLQSLFEGKRELFKGLKIDSLPWDWETTYPVVHIDMTDASGDTPDELKESLFEIVEDLVKSFDLTDDVKRAATPGGYLNKFFQALYKQKGEFVVLIDEYDVPLQGFFGNRAALLRVRKIMHDFYIRLKRNENKIRFLMLTGVTKLTKVSVFSGLNHLTDLTMDDPQYAALLGYTSEEIATYFPKSLEKLAHNFSTDRAGALQRLLDWYDSYRFSAYSEVRVCNPISIGRALTTGIIKSYWVGTAVSTLVMERIAAKHRPILRAVPRRLMNLIFAMRYHSPPSRSCIKADT